MTARSVEGWPRWLAALLMGLLLVLALLIASWLLRTCAAVEPSANVVTLEAERPPPPPPAHPDPTPVLKASLDGAAADGRKLAAEVAALEADVKRALAQCKPVEPPKPPPPKPPPVAQASPPPPPPLPADRWAQKDLSMLQGCWRLGRDTRGSLDQSGRSEMCDVRAGRICFGSNGGGERQSTSVCPSTGTIACAAPITARFGNDDTLGTTQPAVRCSPPTAQWNGPPNGLTCRRVSDTLALCRDRLNFEYEFRRE
jgi:outer membrane murein-binding lipoprotein Lpp